MSDRREPIKLNRLVIVATITGIFIVSSAVIIFYNQGPSKGGQGTLSGSVTIGPVFPVCKAAFTSTGLPSAWSSTQLAVTPESGNTIYVPVSWMLTQGCEASGNFSASLPSGKYQVDLTSCLSEKTRAFGCASMPKTVVISSNNTTFLKISIDTGIR